MNNNQRDPRWAKIGLGDGSTTIGASGCTVSSLGDVLGLTPDVVNQRLQAVGGFLGALLIWAKIEEAFPGVKVNRVWSYNNDDVLAHVPNVIVEVPAAAIGGTGSHWVEYIGNHQCKDPWTGTIRPTSDFPNPTGYCTLDLTNYKPSQTSQNDLQACLDQHTVLVDLCNLKDTNIAQLVGANKELTAKITDLEGQVSKLKSDNENLLKDIQTAKQQASDQAAQTQKVHDEDLSAIGQGLDAQHQRDDLQTTLNVVSQSLGLALGANAKAITDAIAELKKGHDQVAKEAIQQYLYKRTEKLVTGFFSWIKLGFRVWKNKKS